MKAKNHLIYGFGTNDADYVVHKYKNVNGKSVSSWICPYYRAWSRMLERCYSKPRLKRFPTYEGCSVDPEWQLFSTFKEWMAQQPWEGNSLDKDILIPNNKIYAPDKCVFISNALNNFLAGCSNNRGDLPTGVKRNNKSDKFQARCSNPFTGENESLGLFSTQGEAHLAWKKRKHQHALRYAEMQSDQRIAKALVLRYAA